MSKTKLFLLLNAFLVCSPIFAGHYQDGYHAAFSGIVSFLLISVVIWAAGKIFGGKDKDKEE